MHHERPRPAARGRRLAAGRVRRRHAGGGATTGRSKLDGGAEAGAGPADDEGATTTGERAGAAGKVRESGLGATAFVPGKPTPGPAGRTRPCRPSRSGDYLRELRAAVREVRLRVRRSTATSARAASTAASTSTSTPPTASSSYRRFIDEAARPGACSYGGSLSGEHGDGQARGELLPHDVRRRSWCRRSASSSDLGSGREDEPGQGGRRAAADADLRLGAGLRARPVPTRTSLPRRRGQLRARDAALRGRGQVPARTRAAPCARATWSRARRSTPPAAARTCCSRCCRATLIDGRLAATRTCKEALDLCLACKGCKGDCPVNVDMATYKAEFLSHYYEGRLRPAARLRVRPDRRLGAARGRSSPGSPTSSPTRRGWPHWPRLGAGMAPQRTVPHFAPETFRAW